MVKCDDYFSGLVACIVTSRTLRFNQKEERFHVTNSMISFCSMAQEFEILSNNGLSKNFWRVIFEDVWDLTG